MKFKPRSHFFCPDVVENDHGDRFVYEDVVDDEKEDDEEEEEEEEEQELCYQTPSRWKLTQCDNVLKYAKLIIAYTLNVLSEKGKGPITSHLDFKYVRQRIR